MKLLISVLSVLVTLPIWFYLLYVILTAVNANELAWFLYWVYVPATVIVSVLQKHLENKGK
jgi:hypothetical protein